MLGRPAGSLLEFSSPAPFLFLITHTMPVRFGRPVPLDGVATTDGLAQALEPKAGPREFDTQYGESDGDNDNRGPRRHDHYKAKQQHRHADHPDNDAAGRPVGEVYDFLDQRLPRFLLILRPVTVALVR